MSEVELPNPEELEAAAGKRFPKRVALTTALYAVLLAITSLGGNNATKDMMLSQAQAKALEKDRDVGRAKDPYFDFAEVLLQLAIVTASIAILSGSSPVYLFSIVMAVFGAALSLNGFLQLFTLPFLGP